MDVTLIQTQFNGGISANSKSGLANSARFTRALDPWTDADSVTLNPKPIQDHTTTGLVRCMVDAYPYESARYAYDDAGVIYKITSNTWSSDRTVSGGAGAGLTVSKDFLYYAGATKLGRKGLLSGTPAYNDDFLTDGVNDLDLTPTGTVTGNTYTTPTSITETSANEISITPTRDPLRKVQLWVVAKGTGNWTVTVHDEFDNLIGSVTVANASLTNGAYNDFTFSTPLRVNPGQTYHIHVTSTVADGTLRTGTSSDLSTADYKTFFGILISSTDHPMINHTNGVTGTVVIGNVDYMAVYDGDTYNPNKIRIEPGYTIKGWARENEFIVAFATKGATIEAFEEGKLFYWDGISSYYNYSKPVPDGQPNAMVSTKNRIFSVLGSKGDLALGTEPFRALQSAPKLTYGKSVSVLPGAITTWQRKVYFGYSGTDDPNAGNYNWDTGVAPTGIEQGVYAFGADSDRAISVQSVSLEVLTFAFAPSTAISNQTSFQIGCVEAFGEDMYVSYKDGSTYYVDRINKDNGAALKGSYESLIIDLGLNGKTLQPMPQKTKYAHNIIVTCEPLPAGCSLAAKFRKDRTTTWEQAGFSDEGDPVATYDFQGSGRYKEIEIGFDVLSTSGNYPVITGLIFIFDPTGDEQNID